MALFNPLNWMWGAAAAAVSGAAALPAAAGRMLGRRESQVLQFLIYLIGLVLLASAAWWWFLAVRDAYFMPERPPALGAVEIHGGPLTDASALETEFPNLILSELNTLQAKANSAILAYKQARQSVESDAVVIADRRAQTVEAPTQLFEEVDIPLKIADVDFGPLLSWIFSRANDRRQLKLNIVYPDALGTKARVYGTVVGRPDYSFSVTTDGTVENIVSEVASVIIQKGDFKQDRRLPDLPAAEFAIFIQNLDAFAALVRSASLPEATRTERNETLFQSVSQQADSSGWPELHWLAARTAENAGRSEDAARYYRTLLAYYETTDAVTSPGDRQVALQSIGQKVASLEERIAAANAATAALEGASEATIRAQTEKALDAALQAVRAGGICGDWSGLWAVLGTTARQPAATRRIGILGIPSQRVADALRGEIASTAPAAVTRSAQTAPDEFDSYVFSIAQAARSVGDARFVFAGPTGEQTTNAEILQGIESLLQAKVDVLLVSYGSAAKLDPAYRTLLEANHDKTVFVFAAGNSSFGQKEPNRSGYADLQDLAVVAQALDGSGAAAQFSDVADGGVWAPGVDIPYCSLPSGATARGSGTSFAAAIVAGFAAALMEAHPDATPIEISQAIKAASGAPASAPAPLRFDEAARELEALVAARDTGG